MQRAQARRLRAAMTDAEARLWGDLRGRRFAGLGFRRQVPIGRYIADFCCHAARLVVEVDGGQHGTDLGSARDVRRDAFLAGEGYRVLRFWNHEVLAETTAVLDAIWNAAAERTAHRASPETPLPDPPPQGGRERVRRNFPPSPTAAPGVTRFDGRETSPPVPSPLVGEGQGEGSAASPAETPPGSHASPAPLSSASKTGRLS